MSKTDDITMRTLKSLDRCAQLSLSRPAKERLGSKNQPLLRIEPDHVIPDELHLLLRVTVYCFVTLYGRWCSVIRGLGCEEKRENIYKHSSRQCKLVV